MPLRMPKQKKVFPQGDIRALRQALSDVSLLTLAASGRVDVPAVELTDAFSRLLAWRARVVGGITSALLDASPVSEVSGSEEVSSDGDS